MKRFAFGAVLALSLTVSLYAAVVYTTLPLGALVHPDMKVSFTAHQAAVRLHIFTALLALALGPLQFLARLRSRWPKAHRMMGRAYLGIGVLLGGLSGLYVAQFAFGGVVSRAGFSMLALAWLYTGYRGYTAIRGGDVAEHRAWLVRNFALTFAAVTLRLLLPTSMASGIRFEEAYPVIAWLCWVPNLIAAESWIRFGKRPRANRSSVRPHGPPCAIPPARP
jgi:uncharacterized membrane protein